MPEIIVKLGDNIVQKYFFTNETIHIGRSTDNEIVIENLAVSRNHATIECKGSEFILADLDSSNGCYVNGVRVKKGVLNNKDVITIGKHKMYFYHHPVEEKQEQAISPDFGERTMMMTSAPPSFARIEIIRGKQQGQTHELAGLEVRLGRGSDNQIRLSDWFVSKAHAIIEKRKGQYVLRDLGSWRHTYVNGAIVDEAVLNNGDEIQLGPTVTLRFSCEGEQDDELIVSPNAVMTPYQTPPEPDSDGEEAPADINVEIEEEAGVDAGQNSQEGAKFIDDMIESEIMADDDEEGEENEEAEAGIQAKEKDPDEADAQEAYEPENPAEESLEEGSLEGEPEDDDMDEEEALIEEEFALEEEAVNKDDVMDEEEVLDVEKTSEDEEFEGDEDSLEDGKAVDEEEAEDDEKDLIEEETPEEAGDDEWIEADGGNEVEAPVEETAEADEEMLASDEDDMAESEPVAQVTEAESEESSSPEDSESESEPVDEEQARQIQMWERALENKSVVIRRQAARELKKLTGRIHDVE